MCQAYSDSLSTWAWRLPYAIQWGFPIPVIIAIWFAPESPWWLVRHGKDAAALKALSRLHNGESNDDEMLALIQHTVGLERALAVGGTYLDCFKGVNLRRTEIAFMSSLAQNFSGFALSGSTYFFETAYVISRGQGMVNADHAPQWTERLQFLRLDLWTDGAVNCGNFVCRSFDPKDGQTRPVDMWHSCSCCNLGGTRIFGLSAQTGASGNMVSPHPNIPVRGVTDGLPGPKVH